VVAPRPSPDAFEQPRRRTQSYRFRRRQRDISFSFKQGVAGAVKDRTNGSRQPHGGSFSAHGKNCFSATQKVANCIARGTLLRLMRMWHVDIEALFEQARLKALAPKTPVQCRVCQRTILPEKRRGPPRLTCERCAIYHVALSLPRPRQCDYCRTRFWPVRNTARFCSSLCRGYMVNERRRHVYINEQCLGCGTAMSGRARKYCAPTCRQQHRNALRRKSDVPSERHCPECHKRFMPSRAGVIVCSRACAKRRADRNYQGRRSALRCEASV
jgi:hypothetical protein